jgi:glycine/D-amino acid oxidase-like deaminating enzyme
MVELRWAQPLWLHNPPAALRLPALDRTVEADLAIVGGGITGICTAWLLAKAGLTVALIEGLRIGRGSTAASTALLMQEPDRDFVELAGRYGAARARRVWQLSRTATRKMIETIRALDISCALSERDSIYYCQAW